MAAYAYTAINAQGFLSDGEIHAPTVDAAREQLRIRGLLPEKLGVSTRSQSERDADNQECCHEREADRQDLHCSTASRPP